MWPVLSHKARRPSRAGDDRGRRIRGRRSEMDRRNRKAMEGKQVLPAMGRRAKGRARSAQGVRGARLGTVRGTPHSGI